MREVVIATGVRTPRGKGSAKGALHRFAPIDLVGHLLDALVARGVEPSRIDDVILGCATQSGEQGGNIARTAALSRGWTAPGLTINRFCASGLEAIAFAAARVAAGAADLVVAGGVESVSRVPMFADGAPLYVDPALVEKLSTVHMGVSADLVASLLGYSRDELDAYAETTRAKARAAPPDPSLVPLGGLDHDELLDSPPLVLADQPPLFADRAADLAIVRARFPDLEMRHLHTRGSSPQLADAAVAVVVGERSAVEVAGLVPRARIVATASTALDPVLMLTAGQAAIEEALVRANLSPRDLDVVSFAEAFSALCVKLMRELDLDHERMNPNGGTMSRGHAFGATGAILALDVVETLARRGGRYGVAGVSGAAGLGAALVVEILA